MADFGGVLADLEEGPVGAAAGLSIGKCAMAETELGFGRFLYIANPWQTASPHNRTVRSRLASRAPRGREKALNRRIGGELDDE